MQTIQGTAIELLAVDQELLNIPMVAHSLGMLCRFNGHCSEFYSVAEHSVHCAEMAIKVHGKGPVAQWALLHDAHESTIGDITAPVKKALKESGIDISPFERYQQKAFCRRFLGTDAMPDAIQQQVHLIDKSVMMWEKDQVMVTPPAPWTVYDWKEMYYPNWEAKCWGPTAAATYFSELARDLDIK